MKLKLRDLDILESRDMLAGLPEGKLLINTVNAHSFNTALKDGLFAEALDPTKRPEGARAEAYNKVLIPDGASIIWACKFLNAKSRPKMRCAGWDLFAFEMKRLNDSVSDGDGCPKPSSLTPKPKAMFMGSSEKVLRMVKAQAAVSYPNLDIVTYSPPYKPVFSDEDNRAIVKAINDADPDLLWIGMTAPKQEKWTYSHWEELDIHCHVGTIGAVFDFFAGTYQRAPEWFQQHGLEWFYRLVKEPRRMWRRYVLGNPLFVWNVMKEKIFG